MIVQILQPCTFVLQVYSGNYWLIFWIVYVAFPWGDIILAHDNMNPTPEQSRILEKEKLFLIPLYLTFISDYSLYFYMLRAVSLEVYGGSISEIAWMALVLS